MGRSSECGVSSFLLVLTFRSLRSSCKKSPRWRKSTTSLHGGDRPYLATSNVPNTPSVSPCCGYIVVHADLLAAENNRTHHFSTLNPNTTGFNWHLYPIMDRYASTRLGYKPFDSNQYLGPTRDALRYLDLWSMSVKRPDAHLIPQVDCSHYCVPGPPHEWLQFMWHLMLIEAKNNDYDLPNGKWWVSNIEL